MRFESRLGGRTGEPIGGVGVRDSCGDVGVLEDPIGEGGVGHGGGCGWFLFGTTVGMEGKLGLDWAWGWFQLLCCVRDGELSCCWRTDCGLEDPGCVGPGCARMSNDLVPGIGWPCR